MKRFLVGLLFVLCWSGSALAANEYRIEQFPGGLVLSLFVTCDGDGAMEDFTIPSELAGHILYEVRASSGTGTDPDTSVDVDLYRKIGRGVGTGWSTADNIDLLAGLMTAVNLNALVPQKPDPSVTLLGGEVLDVTSQGTADAVFFLELVCFKSN